MKKQLAAATGIFALFVSTFFLSQTNIGKAMAQFAAAPLAANANPIYGFPLPGYVTRWSSKYGAQATIESSQWLYEATGGLGVNTTSPSSTFQVNGSAVGTVTAIINSLSAPTSDIVDVQANGTNVLKIGGTTLGSSAALTVAPLNVSTTGQIVNSPTSAVADIAEWQVNGSTKAAIGAQGTLLLPVFTKTQINALVPDRIGSVVECIDCTVPFTICVATGTAADQFRVLGATQTTPTGNIFGCGSNN